MDVVVDSSGWIEYFTDGRNAAAFEQVVIDRRRVIVPTIVIFEVFKFILRTRGESAAEQAFALLRRGRIVDLDTETSLEAAQVSIDYRLPMADSIILATARRCGATLWTQDVDFAGIDGVRYIARL